MIKVVTMKNIMGQTPTILFINSILDAHYKQILITMKQSFFKIGLSSWIMTLTEYIIV